MGSCNCSEQLNNLGEAPPISYTQMNSTFRESPEIKDIQPQQSETDHFQTYQHLEDSQHSEMHKPKETSARMTTREFQSSSQLVRDLQEQLGQFKIDAVETHHQGVYELPTHSLYKGGFLNGEKSGYGIQIWKNGSVYEGIFQEGMANGRGRMIYHDGDYYIGDWYKDQQNMVMENIIMLMVQFIRENGIRIYNMEKGQNCYRTEVNTQGNINMGKDVEKECLSLQMALIMKGISRMDNSMGKGKIIFYDKQSTYVWPDKRYYKGEWLNGKMNGNGIMVMNDGTKYVGDYKEDKKHGYGVITWPDNREYDGNWLNGKMHGIGIYINSWGVKRKGEWQNGKRVKWCDD